MPNSPQLPFFAHNSTVKAWCLTGRAFSTVLTQDAFDAVNFIDGYNLRLSLTTQTYLTATNPDDYAGALYFSFITPMKDTKYKVFLQFHNVNTLLQNAHVLNSTTYPKTTAGFWVRTTVFRGSPPGSSTNTPVGIRFGVRSAPLGVVVL
jgi:hypothetical protein